MNLVLCYLLGLLMGYAFAILRLSSEGTLKIDHSDPKKDKYLFEVDNLLCLDKKKKVILKIEHHSDLSQK